MNDIERLLNSTFPFVEELLKSYGEFFPLASAIKADDSISQVGTYGGDDRPLSDKLIADLKTGFKFRQNDYKCIAIFYDVMVIDPNTEQKTDSVSVYVENNYEILAYTYYYPYILTADKQITFSKSWKNTTEKEIFK